MYAELAEAGPTLKLAFVAALREAVEVFLIAERFSKVTIELLITFRKTVVFD